MKFDEHGRVVDFGLPQGELDDIINSGLAFRTSGCPGKFQDDISACDRPYGDSPPSDIASYPFQPEGKDIKKIRKQMKIPHRLAFEGTRRRHATGISGSSIPVSSRAV